jgi:hypothetical protein
LSPSKQDDESQNEEMTELFTASRNDDAGEDIDVSTGTFGGKHNLEVKLKDSKQREVKSAAVKPKRPISGISDILTRECPLSDDTHTSQDEFGTVNDREDDGGELKEDVNDEWFDRVNVQLPVVEDVEEQLPL